MCVILFGGCYNKRVVTHTHSHFCIKPSQALYVKYYRLSTEFKSFIARSFTKEHHIHCVSHLPKQNETRLWSSGVKLYSLHKYCKHNTTRASTTQTNALRSLLRYDVSTALQMYQAHIYQFIHTVKSINTFWLLGLSWAASLPVHQTAIYKGFPPYEQPYIYRLRETLLCYMFNFTGNLPLTWSRKINTNRDLYTGIGRNANNNITKIHDSTRWPRI